MFTVSGNIYSIAVSDEIMDKVMDIKKILHSYTNDPSIYAYKQEDNRLIDIAAQIVVDMFISEFELDDGDKVIINLSYNNRTVSILLTKFPEKSILRGYSYSVEY